MAIIKTSDLGGAALDWAVAKCNGKGIEFDDPRDPWLTVDGIADQPLDSYTPSGDWSQGGPIIEREGIELLCNTTADEALRFIEGSHADWRAAKRPIGRNARYFGVTPLVAAMRCFVAQQLGEQVEVPDEIPVTEHLFVLYRRESIMRPADPPLGYPCWAEDADHAEEQCLEAYPDADIVWVSNGKTMRDALADYWGLEQNRSEEAQPRPQQERPKG